VLDWTLILLPPLFGAIVSYYILPRVGLITPFLPLLAGIAILPLSVILFDIITYFSSEEQIRQLTNTYVKPWQRYVVVSVLLGMKEVLVCNYYEAKNRLTDLAQFLETTNNTRYLRDVLTIPSLRFLKRRDTGIVFLKRTRLLRKCRLDSLGRKIKIVRKLTVMLTVGREREVASDVEQIAKSIVPDYQKVKGEIAEELGINETLDETSLLAIDNKEYLGLLEDVKPPEELELQIWSILIPERTRAITPRGLKHLILYNAVVWVFILAMMIGFLILMMSNAFPFFWESATLTDRLFLLTSVTLLLVSIVLESMIIVPFVTSYRSLDGVLKDRAIFTKQDLARASLRILSDGLKRLRLPDAIDFPDRSVSPAEFVYRCACAFLPKRPHSVRKGLMRFRTSHTIGILRHEFLHTASRIDAAMSESQLTGSRNMTWTELADLSLQITNLCEGPLPNKPQALNVGQKTLVWLYANALRIKRFNQIEIADVGRLPSYTTT